MNFLTILLQASLVAGVSDKGFGTIDNIAGINGSGCAYTSIAGAVAAANEGDTIIIEPGTHEGLIGEIGTSVTLVSGQAGAPGFTGCELEDPAATFNTVRLSGDGDSDDSVGGLVHVLDGASVVFRNLGLRNANATNGGILAITDGGNVTLDRVQVFDGQASASGGLIYVEGDTASLSITGSSELQSGRATIGDGGAIAMFGGSLSVEDTQFGGNFLVLVLPTPDNAAVGNGGAIYASGATITLLSGTEFLGNKAGSDGGGIYALNTQITGAGTLFANNIATLRGGALAMNDSVGAFTDSIFDDNRVTDGVTNSGGGAIFLEERTTLDLDHVTATANDSTHLGGAILLQSGSEMLIGNDSTISNNNAFSGGAIYVTSATISIDTTTLANNVAGPSGGAIYCISCNLTLGNRTILSDNLAEDGGAIYAFGTGGRSVNLDGVTLTSNRASSVNQQRGRGGALYMNAGSLTVTRSLFEENRADEIGGGVYLGNQSQIGNSSVVISNSEFRANIASAGDADEAGGGLAAVGPVSLTIRSVQFNLNAAGLRGGGVTIESVPAANLTNVHFDGNQSSVGGAYYSSNSNVQFTTDFASCDPFSLAANDYCSLFINNEANFSGGAMYIEDDSTVSTVQLRRVALLNNRVGSSDPSNGAAIEVTSSVPSVLSLIDSLVADNGTAGNDGSAISIGGSHQLSLGHITLAGNQASPVWVSDANSVVDIHSSILYLNGAGPRVAFGVAFNRSCNNSQAPQVGSQSMGGNLGNPNFATTARGDYRLSTVSVSTDQCEIDSQRDLDGLFREPTTLADQGAFERDGVLMGPDNLFADSFESP